MSEDLLLRRRALISLNEQGDPDDGRFMVVSAFANANGLNSSRSEKKAFWFSSDFGETWTPVRTGSVELNLYGYPWIGHVGSSGGFGVYQPYGYIQVYPFESASTFRLFSTTNWSQSGSSYTGSSFQNSYGNGPFACTAPTVKRDNVVDIYTGIWKMYASRASSVAAAYRGLAREIPSGIKSCSFGNAAAPKIPNVAASASFFNRFSGMSDDGRYTLIPYLNSASNGRVLQHVTGSDLTMTAGSSASGSMPSVEGIVQTSLSSGGKYALLAISGSGFYRSNNHISTWDKITTTNISTAYSTCCAVSRDGKVQYVGGLMTGREDGRLWRSEDYGNTWTQTSALINTIGMFDLKCSGDGRILLMVRGGIPSLTSREIWRSLDYGETWSKITWSGTYLIPFDCNLYRSNRIFDI